MPNSVTANPATGRVPLDVEDETYTLVLDVNALIELESLLGVRAFEVTGKMAPGQPGLSLTELRGLIWAGLQREHPDVTLAEAGRIIQVLTPKAAMLKALEAIAANYPTKTEAAPGSATPPGPRPRRGKAGTG